MPYDASTGVYTSALPEVKENPDDLSIFDFMFEGKGSKQPEETWLIDSVTGRTLTRQQAHDRSLDIARALAESHGLGWNDTLALFSGNEVDYATTLWATFRLGGIVTPANPSYTPTELAYQLNLGRSS
jgi:acyl-CoA synthetase (AMP-forming)/AMP-acid ligase II